MEDITLSQVFENKTVFSQTAEQPIDADFTLPEYYPDVEKILKCCIAPYVVSKGMNGNTVTVDGTAVITVIYVGNDNMLNSFEYQYPFSKNFDAAENTGDLCICADASKDYINCRAVSGRKLDLHGAISITLKLIKREMTEIVSDVGSKDIETKKEEILMAVPMGCNEKYMNIEEEIEIGTGAKDINCIIRYDGVPTAGEAKLLAGKASIRGELSVNLLYCDNEGEIISVKESFPFTQMLSLENTNELCKCDTDIKLCFLEIKPKSDAEGNLRSFSVNAKVLITVNTVCEEKLLAVCDAYSKKCETQIEFTDITASRILSNINDEFISKQALEFRENEITRILDMWCRCNTDNLLAKDGRLTVSGKIKIYIIALDAEELPVFFEKEIPFNYQKEICENNLKITASVSVGVKNCGYTLLSNGDMEIRAELNISACIFEHIEKKVIKDIVLNCDKPIKQNKEYAMVIYYADGGETVWDVAAKYLADVEEIKQINGINDDVLEEGKMLLLPIG